MLSASKLKSRHTALWLQTASGRNFGREKWNGAAEAGGVGNSFYWVYMVRFRQLGSASVRRVRNCPNVRWSLFQLAARQTCHVPKLSPSVTLKCPWDNIFRKRQNKAAQQLGESTMLNNSARTKVSKEALARERHFTETWPALSAYPFFLRCFHAFGDVQRIMM